MDDLDELAIAAGNAPRDSDVDPPIWMVADGDVESGPLTLRQIAALSRSGALSATAHAWREGMPAWLPVAKLVGGHGEPQRARSWRRYRGQPTNRVAAVFCALLVPEFGIHKFLIGAVGEGTFILGGTMALGLGLVASMVAPWVFPPLLFFAVSLFWGVIMRFVGFIEAILYLSKSEEQFWNQYHARRQSWL